MGQPSGKVLGGTLGVPRFEFGFQADPGHQGSGCGDPSEPASTSEQLSPLLVAFCTCTMSQDMEELFVPIHQLLPNLQGAVLQRQCAAAGPGGISRQLVHCERGLCPPHILLPRSGTEQIRIHIDLQPGKE